jgi:hypothetical protein
MRWRFVCGFGLAGVATASAFGQFAVDRVPQTPPPAQTLPAGGPVPSALPPGLQPVVPASVGAYTPPPGGLMPAGGFPGTGLGSVNPQPPLPPVSPPPKLEIESCLGPNHPWVLKPEHGPYFICVKSYSRPHRPTPEDNGPSARELAETLANEIRTIHKQQAFLYEFISEERKAEAAAMAAERERGRQYLEQLKVRQQQSELGGMEFMAPDNKLRFKTQNYRDQVAVMVGGFQSDVDARKALDYVHAWTPPTNNILMDGAAVAQVVSTDKAYIKNNYINPYKSAWVVPNPLIARQNPSASIPVEPFIVKLNEGHPYNLLKAKKDWTIGVKVFNAPFEIVTRDKEASSGALVKMPNGSKAGNALLAGEIQAEQLAKVLREMKDENGRSLGLEAFVLLTRTSSIVTVGQFDGPTDPALIQTHKLLTSMQMKVTEDKTGTKPSTTTPKMFEDHLAPMPIPKP